MGILGRFWGPLGALLGALGALLGPSWAPLGALLGHLGAILRPQKPIGSEKARMRQSVKIQLRTGFGLVGPSWRASWSPLRLHRKPLESSQSEAKHLERLVNWTAILQIGVGFVEASWGFIGGLSWTLLGDVGAILKPSWGAPDCLQSPLGTFSRF